jgi:hypothetical protein
MKTFIHWIHGLGAAFIGGGAGAVSAAFSAMLLDPVKFNLADGLGKVLKMMGMTFVVSGIISTAMYLKQSPLPPEEGEQPGI